VFKPSAILKQRINSGSDGDIEYRVAAAIWRAANVNGDASAARAGNSSADERRVD
jgi:hypothetical protein